ncbi:protocadherin-23 isoform X2 [Dermochelys coriacea]|uniref:protocadherin-23 isoform X2 n=1 Tax=Dermochelys coriacea TaxID=27794 RepID=UPI001CA92F4C|nr:protocadherin-23 isoform X2 [Dermochelys coriacea]
MGQRPRPPRASGGCQRQQERPLPPGSGRRGGLGAPGAGPLALLVALWLSAAGGCSAQLYNLSLAVDEGLPADTLVGDIRAGLPPGGEQPGGFFLSEGSGESALLADFHVQADTGIIRTARRLDRERRARYSFVAATLRGEMVQVEIAVTDVNDHPPRFPRDSLRLNVSELSPPGTAFRLPGARDPDAGSFGTQGYTLLAEGQEAPPPLFQLRCGSPPEPLDLVLLRRLDRERADSHRLVVEAWDGGSPRLSGRLRVEIRVLDENDNAPAFSQREYRARVREDAAPGTAVCRLLATDPDLGANGEVRYLINRRQSDPAAYFAVEERSGLLRVNRPLDREARALHRVIVQARDGGAQPEVGSALVSIAVLDVNDNSPAIHVLYLTEGGGARLSEAARPGDYVARVSVSDPDEAGDEIGLTLQGGDGTFALRPGGAAGLYFLRVEGPLDRERRDLYELRLAATDAGSPPLSARETLLLRIADINDQPPAFPQPRYRAAVSEAASPGTTVLRLSASDADEPGSPNAQVRYALEAAPGPGGPELFRIDPLSGVISTRRGLDREREAALELRVVARDLGEPPLSASCLVSVLVEDANDNEPVFEQQVYNASLAEHAGPGHCLLQAKATDADAGQFGHIDYLLYDGFHNYEKSKAFWIDPHTGHICVCQDIDREEDPATYDLLVKATDGGGLSAQAFVRIEIEDINDNQPIFDPASYVTSISSHTHPGTEIINVIATDRDSGIYGVVTYELVPGEFSSLFTVDTSSGIIYLISTLSHLDHTMMFLTVSARDGGGLTSVVNASVTVNILQTTLAPAIFERSRYTFSVPEDVPEGSPVGTVKAREPLNTLEVISYKISSGDPYGRFSIDPQFGIILTKKQLDHETQSLIVLTVQSQLGSSPVYSSTQVNISVIDVNDNPPVFLTESDKITISHSTVPGTALYIAHAEDKDSGLNGVIKYTIANRQSNAFSIDPSLGVVYLTRTLFTDKQHEYALHITAEDYGTPPLSSLIMLTVIVEEQKMGTTLTFENLVYQVEVSETSSLNAKILQVQAHTQVPQHTDSQMVYSLEPSTDSAAFGIDPVTGWIYLRKYLNYEFTQMYNFRAFVSSPEDSSGQNASTSVTVNVLDENDNSPMFMRDLYFFEVEESPVPRGVVGTITAVDRDSGRNGQLSYFLLSDGKFFKINSNTGEIINWVALDHEQKTHHRLIVLVTDHGAPQRNATTTAYILVADLNDNQPYFPQIPSGKEVTFKVLEGQPEGTLVTTVFAKDLDFGNNGVVLYSILSEDSFAHFQIDANSGELRTTEALSYNWRPNYRILVTASDQGMPPLQGHVVVNIQVIPFSKERSVFSQDIRHFVIPENFKPAQILSSVKLPGHYLQTNRKLHFSVSEEEGDAHFEIDSSTGDLFLSKELDYETTSHFLLRVVMKDYNKNPPQNYTVFLSIDVEDQNDHSPYFQDNFIVIGIEENVPVGTLVYTFNAKDGDGSFLNSRVQYSIETSNSGENPFLIHPLYGTLITAFPLDREVTHSVVLTVSASDQAINLTERRLGSLTAKIVILDINDNSPSFVSSSLSYVMENAEVGSLVHHVIAEDPDEGRNGQVTYHILSGNENEAFLLDKTTGLLTTAFPLDHKSQEYYRLTIMALDDGTPALSATQMLIVSILDVNDERPVFQKQLYEAAVSENQDPGEFVIKVEAVDRDSGINSLLQYEILPGNGFEIFQINSDTGQVMTTASLDREAQEILSIKGTSLLTVEAYDDNLLGKGIKYRLFSDNEDIFSIHPITGELTVKESKFLDHEVKSKVHLTVLAENGLNSAHCGVTVWVQDVNDNAPKFEQSSYKTSVWEGQIYNTYVMQIFATDLDSGLNGEIEYSILSGNENKTFLIDSTRGILATNAILNHEDISSYRLVVQVADRGIPSLSATSIVTIQVVDVNDNTPTIQPVGKVEVSENAPPGFVVTQVSANDVDLSPALLYSFTEDGNPGMKFAINQHTGVVTLVKPLDFEETAQYELWISVSDSVHQTEAQLTIHVLDVNDNPPVFTQYSYQVTVPELAPVGTSVLTVSAIDRDSEHNGIISYKILSSYEGFSIDHKNGSVFTAKPVPHLGKSSVIHLLIEAKDHGDPALTAVTSVEIQIQDVNNYAPQFTMALYNASVSEDASVGGTILTFSAIDYDWIQENTYIEYSISSSNTNNLFHVETSVIESTPPYKMVGNLVLSSPLDRETASSHYVIILASDRGTPPLNSSATVLITVLDVNDNPPVFSNLEYRIHVRENIPIGSHITVISATDCDAGANAEVTYTIISGNDKGHFRLDGKTGSVDLIRTLDYEETIKFTLTIQASDGGVNVRNVAFSVVFVNVLDDNDYAPLFLFPSLNCVVHENLPAFSFVCTVYALDFDTGPYGHLNYSIQSSCLSDHGSPQDHDMFFIDSLTGDIQTKQMLDYESQNKYCFIAQAKDKGESIATLTVQIDVEGTDEFDPVFTKDQYIFGLPEKNEAGQMVGKVAASDNDAGLDGVIHYSLLKPSPFFSVNQSNGNIYLTRTLYRKKSSTKRKDDSLELLVRAHSPKLDSKSTICTVLVNISNSPENYSIASVNILSISLTISFVVFLLLAISLIALILRYKRKDIINSCMKRETSSSSADLSLTHEDNIPKDCQKLQSTESSTLPMGSITEWLSLVGIREKEDIGIPSRHSDSSGHGSAEGETAEDEEIKRINEHQCRKGLGSALSERGSCVPDSGIPRDSDQLSCQSGETDVFAATQNAESFHTFKDEGGGEGCDPNYAHNKMLSQTLQKIGIKERDIMTDITREYIFISDGQDSRYGSLVTLVASDEDLRGSYNWDYLLTWEPRFQPLASVFDDIAKLKDESLQIHSFPKEKKSFIFPPPLITSVAQSGIRTVPPQLPTIIPGQAFKKYPRSPLIHNLRYPSPAMTPSFSPSLSLLTMQSPTASPVRSDEGLAGTCQIGQIHATEEEVQV